MEGEADSVYSRDTHSPQCRLRRAPLAQLVEQLPLKETVGGSIPSRRTIKNIHQLLMDVFNVKLLRGAWCRRQRRMVGNY